MNLFERGNPAMYSHAGGGAIMPLVVWPRPGGELSVQTMALASPNTARYFSCCVDLEDFPALVEEFTADPETCLVERFGRTWTAGPPPKRHTGLTLEDLGL
jgi:hypothetical protein